ncbi:MAG TPA: transposase [Porphyromonadaceae bacterium]|nr:transposase [Porphyromonadaceae bacterium]
MDKTRRFRCWACGSLAVIKWGKQQGKQRYSCKDCGIFSTRSNPGVSKKNREIWFREWITGKQTFTQLVAKSGYSERTLKYYFYDYLEHYPRWQIRRSESVNLLVDGTYFANKVCLVLYRDDRVKATVLYRLTDGEWEEELREDIENLLNLGIIIESITCDGVRNLLRAIRKVSPDTVIQRCLAHIQRETLQWLTRRPQSQAGYELREIIKRLHTIDDRNKWGYWVVDIVRWYDRHKDFVNAKSYQPQTKRYWYTHKSVRKAFIHIRRALPDMFHYLDNPKIPKTTNALESFFGHLKQNISLHRGLSKEHYKNYLKWYLFFKSNEK